MNIPQIVVRVMTNLPLAVTGYTSPNPTIKEEIKNEYKECTCRHSSNYKPK
jgi:hypothetical protein